MTYSDGQRRGRLRVPASAGVEPMNERWRGIGRGLAGRRSYLSVLFVLVGLASVLIAGGPGVAGGESAEQDLLVYPGAAQNNTAAQLDTFYATYGGREAFSDAHREVIEAQLYAEDAIAGGDYGAARRRLDEVFAKYPRSNPVWENMRDANGIFGGGNNPTAYAGLRMLDEAARVATSNRPAPDAPLRMTVVVPDCAETNGVNRPIQVDTYNQNVANDYNALRQALHVFEEYVWALTDGARRLEVEFINPTRCVALGDGVEIVGLANYGAEAAALPLDVRARTDMYWIVTPLPVESIGFHGGMGFNGVKPMFLSDQLTTIRFAGQARTEVERRLFFSAWFQHEFAHHLFIHVYPEYNFEYGPGHNWFDPNHWPADFTGNRSWEADFFIESFHRRFRGATPRMSERLKTTDKPLLVSDPGGNWEQCATEGGRCSFNGTKIVQYGAPGRYDYFAVTDGTLCLNSAFGRDPASGAAKTCSLQSDGPPVVGDPGGRWQQCATEGGRCSFNGTKIVQYGASGRYDYFRVTDGTLCTNAALGRDPASGAAKTCSLQSDDPPVVGDPGGYWTQCATEGGRCSFNGTQTVQYGAPGRYDYFEVTDGTLCTNAAFGEDPAPGTPKTCSLPSNTPPVVGDPGGYWEQCSTEGGRCSFSGTQIVQYGAPGRYDYYQVTDGTLCINSAFGEDPAPGVPKTCSLPSNTPPVVGDPGGRWQQCATEGGRCSFNGTQIVQYGAPGRFGYYQVTDGTLCLNSAFGEDPASGTPKTCSLQTSG